MDTIVCSLLPESLPSFIKTLLPIGRFKNYTFLKNIPDTHIQSSLFSNFILSSKVKASIVIPVKDEEAYIERTLLAFSKQVDIWGKPLDTLEFEILVLANNCSDRSVLMIKDFQKRHPNLNIHLEEITLVAHQANIGHVRKQLKEAAYYRLVKNGGGIIMTTDADTCVAPDWIAQNQFEIEKGADAVGGRILFCKDELECLDGLTYSHHFWNEN